MGETEKQTEELALLKRISAQVGVVEAKIDANALAMGDLTAKLDKLEGVVEKLERDLRGAKFSAVMWGSVSGATAGALAAIGWELLKARMGL